jgi:hypothetical protein
VPVLRPAAAVVVAALALFAGVSAAQVPTATVSGDFDGCADTAPFLTVDLTGTPPWTLTWSDSVVQSGITATPATRQAAFIDGTTVYTVSTVQDSVSSGPGSGSATVTIRPNPTASINKLSVCPGIFSVTGSGGVSCSWSPTDGVQDPNSCTTGITPLTTTTYTLTVTSNEGCKATNSVQLHPGPQGSASGGGTICQGGTIQLSGTPTPSGPFGHCSWTPSAGLSDASSCTPLASPSATTTYHFHFIDFDGCPTTNDATTTVAVNPKPATPAISAPASAQPGQTGLAASVAQHAAANYQWFIVGGTINGGNGTASITFTAGSGNSVSLAVIETSAAGCVSDSGDATVALSAAVSATVSGGGAICAGDSATLRAALTGAGPWTLAWSDGFVQSNVAASPATRSVSPSATTTYAVTQVSDTVGSASGTGSAVVTVNARPAVPAILVPASARPSQAGLVAAVQGHAGSTYAWTVANGTLTSGAGTSTIVFTAGAAGTLTLTVVETNAAGCASPAATMTLGVIVCVVPAAPSLAAASASLTEGESAALSWSAEPELDADGGYVVETSFDGFDTVALAFSTQLTSAVVPTAVLGAARTLSVRVHAVQGCGVPGALSNVVAIAVSPKPAQLVVTQSALSLVATVGGTPPAGVVTFKNVGGAAGHAVLSASGGFFSLSASQLDMAAGAEASVTANVPADELAAPGAFSGLLTVAGASALELPVALTVAAPPSGPSPKVQASSSTLLFSAPAGQAPAPQTLTLTVDPPGAGVFLVAEVSPGGSWLTLSSALSHPVPPSGVVALTVSVDRARRAPGDGAPPLRTLLRVTPAGGDPLADSAIVEVVDVEPAPVESAAGARGVRPRGGLASPPAGGASFIVPSVVQSASGVSGALFSSDGWLRNLSSVPVEADLFFTPDGKNGLTDPSALKTTLTVAAGSTLRLSGLLGTLFGVTGTSGQLEVRSSAPGSLSLRTVTRSLAAGGSFSTEMPTVSFGSGVGVGGGETVIPGIDDDETSRANLILAETTGASARVAITVNGPDGVPIGTLIRDVPPYGKVQVNRLGASAAPGVMLSGGWASVTVTGGAGKVVAVATVIDNRSGSFSAILGRVPAPPPSSRRPQATADLTYVVPAAVRTVGLFDTRFSTNLSLVNGTAQPVDLSLTYRYVDQDDGGAVKSAVSHVTIAPRGSLPRSLGTDVVAALFGVSARSYGSIFASGDLSRIVASAAIAAQVDPNDASKGQKTAQVNGVFLDDPSVMARNEAERRFAGAEKTVQARTNLVLVEVGGAPANVLVRVSTNTGAPVAERTISVGANAYVQVDDVFGPAGVALGDGPFQDMEVTARVVDGGGRVVALATVNDNVTRSPQVFVLEQPAPPPNPSIGF